MIITNNVMEHHLTIQMVLHIFFNKPFWIVTWLQIHTPHMQLLIIQQSSSIYNKDFLSSYSADKSATIFLYMAYIRVRDMNPVSLLLMSTIGRYSALHFSNFFMTSSIGSLV